jgi:hypothetical protein
MNIDTLKLPKRIGLKDVVEIGIASNQKFLDLINTEDGCRSLFGHFRAAYTAGAWGKPADMKTFRIQNRDIEDVKGIKLARTIISKVGDAYYGSMIVMNAPAETLPLYLGRPDTGPMASFRLEHNI